MALSIGYYLFEMVNCWKCEELLKTEAVDFREALTSVGKGDTNSQKMFQIDVRNLGSCAKGIFLRQAKTDSGIRCKEFCPSHPNNCWVVLSISTCGDQETEIDCVDINGDTVIDADPELMIGTIADDENDWLDTAYSFSTNIFIRIEKTGPNQIKLGKP